MFIHNRCVFPGYRWCGPRCKGPGPPANPVDACCMEHDLCLDSGTNPCYCDRMFMDSLRPYLEGPYPENRHARLMFLAMRIRSRFTC
jgi:hypothetical protein